MTHAHLYIILSYSLTLFRLNVSQPLYVNIIREPLDRLVSWFYYRRSNMPLRTKRLGNSRRNMVGVIADSYQL